MDASHYVHFDERYADVVNYDVDYTSCMMSSEDLSENKRKWSLRQPDMKMDEEKNEEEKEENEDRGKHLGGQELRLVEEDS